MIVYFSILKISQHLITSLQIGMILLLLISRNIVKKLLLITPTKQKQEMKKQMQWKNCINHIQT